MNQIPPLQSRPARLFFGAVNAVTALLLFWLGGQAAVFVSDEVDLFAGKEWQATLITVAMAAFLYLGLLFFFRRVLYPPEQQKARCLRTARITLWVLLAAVQIVFLCCFDVKQITDPYMVNDQALSIALGKESVISPDNLYFQIYSNNHFTLTMTVGFYRLLRLLGVHLYSNLPFGILDTLLTDLSVWLAADAIRRVKDEKYEIGFLLLTTLNPLTYLLVYWEYTMIYSLPVMAAEVWLFVRCLTDSDARLTVRICRLSLIGALAVLGYFIRPTALIPVIAFGILCALRARPDKRRFLRSACALACAAALSVAFFAGCKALSTKYVSRTDRYFPVTHWIMVGLTERGNLIGDDYFFTNSFATTSEMKTATVSVIKERCRQYSPIGFVKHCVKKLNTTWQDGSVRYWTRLQTDTRTTSLYPWTAGDKADLLILYCQAFRLVIFFAAAGCLGIKTYRKTTDIPVCYAALTLFGAILFYQIWEAKSIYCTSFIPLLLFLSDDCFAGAASVRRRIPVRVMKAAGVIALTVTGAAGIVCFDSMTGTSTYKRPVIFCDTDHLSLYCHAYDTVALCDETLVQTFVTDRPFDEIRIKSYARDGTAQYDVTLEDQEGNPLYRQHLDYFSPQNTYTTLSCGHQKPSGKQTYTIRIESENKGQYDTIKWISKKALASDQYNGEGTLGGKPIPDLNLIVSRTVTEPYLPAGACVALVMTALLAESGMLWALCRRRQPEPSAVQRTEPILPSGTAGGRIKGADRLMCPRLVIVIPCYNEEEVLPITSKQFREELELLIRKGRVSPDSRILLVNDGSRDRTWEIICELARDCELFEGISQSRNRGHQSSLLAGLMEVRDCCDITISIDCDGQDDITAMEKMVDAYAEGAEVVYGVRSKRETDTFFKRFTAESFYRLLSAMGAEVVFNHADYRLVSAKVLQAFSDFKEVNIFLRGMFPLVGFRSTSVYYERSERLAGKSHYPLSKMLGLAIDGITSLSIKPIRFITGIGVIVALFSFIGVIWSIVEYFTHHAVIGWASTVSIICFIGGIQLISLGVLGEYIGKIYMETKARPRYIISERTENAPHSGK